MNRHSISNIQYPETGIQYPFRSNQLTILGTIMKYYPIFTDMHDKLVLVIGQYRVLDFKMQKLLEAGTIIKFVSGLLPENLKQYVKADRIIYINDKFKTEFLDDVWLVICGSDDNKLKSVIKEETEKRKIFCNFVDEAPISSFISPTVIDKGDITIAISTKGKSPALNKYLKNEIISHIGDEYIVFNELLGKMRDKVINNITTQKQRGDLFETIIHNPAVLVLIKNHKHTEAEKMINDIVDKEIIRLRSNNNN